MKTYVKTLLITIVVSILISGCVSQQALERKKEFKKLLLADSAYYAGQRLGIKYSMLTNNELDPKDRAVVKKVMGVLDVLSYDIFTKDDIDKLIKNMKPELESAGMTGPDLEYATRISINILSHVKFLCKKDENVGIVIENFREGVANSIRTYGSTNN